jgi:hypothetical protein
VWQTYDYDLDVNGSYYGARKACEPLHVQASLADWRVHAVNQTAGALSGARVSAELRDLHGKRLADATGRTLDVAASTAAEAFTVPFGSDLPDLHLLVMRLTDRHGALLSDNTYLRYRAASDVRALGALAGARISARVRHGGPDGGTLTVHNTGGVVGAMVRVSVRDAHSDERVLPTRYSDNYLWLLPGETRTVEASWPARALPSGKPRFTVEALNLPRRRV